MHPTARASQKQTGREWELLVCAARTVPNASSAARIRALVGHDVDWNRLIALAGTHHVVPLLYHSLRTVCPESVPRATLWILERSFASNVARNLALTCELTELLKTFEADGIPAIPFKGPTLASVAYGGLALRQAGDLDILVHPGDAIRARQVLESRGFRPYFDIPEDLELRHSHHFMMVRDERPVTVEIHWRLIRPNLCFALSEKRLWQAFSTTRIAGADIPCLATPELLLYLCAHGAKHCWQRLSWICDIAELARAEHDLDWASIIPRARAMGAARLLSVGLLLAVDMLDAPVPDAVARAVRSDAVACALAREVRERYLPEADTEPPFAEMWRFNLRARERPRDRLRCRTRLMTRAFGPNQRDFAFLRLPHRLSFLYPAVKPVRLASEFALNPSRSLRLIGDLMGFRSPVRANQSYTL